MVRLADVPALRCPICRGPLAWRGLVRGPADGQRISEGTLLCRICQEPFPVERGVARLYRDDDVRGSDRLLRVVYDGLPSVHDPMVRLTFPWAVGETEAESRARYLARLRLEALPPPDDGAAPGAVAHCAHCASSRSGSAPAATWRSCASGWRAARSRCGASISAWACLRCGAAPALSRRSRHAARRRRRPRPAVPGSRFDRVFHVGAVNCYRDPARALAEMVRVARAGTPLVVVDERLDPDKRHSLFHGLLFKWIDDLRSRSPRAGRVAAPGRHPRGGRAAGPLLLLPELRHYRAATAPGTPPSAA